MRLPVRRLLTLADVADLTHNREQMGFRLWRRVRIAPGLTMNLSKSGASWSLGTRGAHLTLGHGHIRQTVGIPGTGMYWTSVSGAGRQQTRQVVRRAVRRAPPPAERLTQTPEQSRQTAITCLLVLAVIGTAGLALIPIVIWRVARTRRLKHEPAFLAGELLSKAMAAQDQDAVGFLHAAMDTDPRGKDTLTSCANWFYEHQCWADAADAYAALLHVSSATPYEIKYGKSLNGAGHADEALVEFQHLLAQSLDESDHAYVLSQIAMAFMLKGDVSQALAFVNQVSLGKHNLNSGEQTALMMQATCRYQLGQKAKGIEDLERLYAISGSAVIAELKARMQNGSFVIDPVIPYPAWYPTKVEVREGPSVEEVTDNHDEALAVGSISPDSAWEWDGSKWIPTPASGAANQMGSAALGSEIHTSQATDEKTVSSFQPAAAEVPPQIAAFPGSPVVTSLSAPSSTASPAEDALVEGSAFSDPALNVTEPAKSAPIFSADGNWWWNGSAWTASLSPDGRWRWDGKTWVPLPASKTDAV